jgi:signal transduction histidine kinase
VIDTGMGIPKDKLATIFEQYEQVNSHVQKKYKGTGLGLSISKN